MSPFSREILIQVIKDAMTSAGENPRSVSLRAGLSQDTLRDFFRGKTHILRADKLHSIFRVLELNDANLSGANKVPLVGFVGAGGQIYSMDDHMSGNALEMIEAPAEAVEEGAVAARIKGNSMWPAYKDGEIIYWVKDCDYDRSFLNCDCIIELQDGRMLLKTLQKGSSPSLFTLASYNEPPLVDTPIKWACPVKWTKKF